MKVYLIKRLQIGNTQGGAIDEVFEDCCCDTFVFGTLEKARDQMRELYNQDRFDFFDIQEGMTDEEIENEGLREEGYYEDTLNEDNYRVAKWDDCGEGRDVYCVIEEVEVE